MHFGTMSFEPNQYISKLSTLVLSFVLLFSSLLIFYPIVVVKMSINLDPQTLALTAQFLQQMRQSNPAASPQAQPAQQPSTDAPAPPISPYITSRPPVANLPQSTRGHPNLATSAPPLFSGRSILGASSLAVSMAGNTNHARQAGGSRLSDRPTRTEISQANTSRNEAIAAHFPPQPTLPSRIRRRGRAPPTPTLPDDTAPESVFQVDSLTSEEFVHIECHVHLPTEHPNASLHLTLNLASSFISDLDKNGCRFIYRLRSDTTIISIIETVSQDMGRSDRKWEFREHSHHLRQHLRRHETLHLQLLGLGNRGIPRRSDGLVGLSRQPADSDLTLRGLFTPSNSHKYCKPHLTIRGKRLILNFVVVQLGITGLAKIPPRLTSHPRRHSCLPQLMHAVYSPGNETGTTSSDWTPPTCESGGETDDDDDDEMEVEVALVESDQENLPSSPSLIPNITVLPISSERSSNEESLPSPSSLSQSGLWATTWVPSTGRYRALYNAPDFAKSLFETAGSSSPPTRLIISGTSISEMSLALVTKIKAANARNDFTEILSPERSFDLLRDDGTLLSTGLGIGRETLTFAWLSYQKHAGEWFLPRFGGQSSIATTMPLASATFVNRDRRSNLVVLGCLAGLMLIHGMAPEPLSPAVIQWAANKCDVRSLTREFVGEWFAELKGLMDDWVASLQGRDLRQHQTLGLNMIYTCLIGPQPPAHAELMDFLKGLRMPCRNGFDLMQVLRSDPSGTAGFMSRTWTSIIHDFDSLKPQISFFTPTRAAAQEYIELSNPVLDMDLWSLLQDFMKKSGAPCPALFEVAKPNLCSLIPFDKIDNPAFRPMALCWAATGSPHLDPDDQRNISVHFVGPDDQGYHSDSVKRAGLMKAGTICFRACFRTVRIPLIYLAHLHDQSYPAKDHEGNDTEPFTLQQAIENWLFTETLGGIGNLTVL
ncbi:hypothetical protein K438DRAFT_1930208 [Mycena galopus ATCC 62051]|nr:hypothetical protein K438DRAFT_1930208 [Mycena galopus ATCC 62051]